MNLRIDYSTLAAYLSCGHKFKYRHLNNVIGRESSAALSFGSAFHRGVEWLLSAQNNVTDATWQELRYLAANNPPIVNINDVEDEAGRALHGLVGELNLQNSPLLRIPNNQRRSLEHLLTLLVRYHDHYNPGHGIPYRETEAQAEKFLGTTASGDNVIYVGNIDGVTDNAVVERKTTYSISSFLDKVTPNNQITGYAFLTGKQNCIVDLIDTTGYGISKGAATASPERWLINTKPANLFMRTETFRSEAQIEEWRSETLRACEALIRDIRDNKFTKRTDACTDFNSVCPFIDLCRTHDPTVRATIIDGMLTEEWDSFSLSE